MVLTDREIQAALNNGQIVITPRPDPSCFSSTSVDLTLDARGARWKKPKGGAIVVISPADPAFSYQTVFEEYTESFDMKAGFEIEPSGFILAWTKEFVSLPSQAKLAARVEGKSSLARLGVGVHVTAPTIHAGFEGNIQLEVFNHSPLPIKFVPGMKICQLIFEQTLGTPERGYAGQFAGQKAK